MEKLEFYACICTAMSTVIAAIISAIALIKVNKIDNQDRIRRSLWVMEEYMCRLGKYIASPSKENKELYEAIYLVLNLYVADEMKEKSKEIDDYIEKGDIKSAKQKAIELTVWYSKQYNMKRYAPRKIILKH